MSTYGEFFQQLREIKSSTTWLEGLGACYGKLAKDVQVGDMLGWNNGHVSKVVAIPTQSPTVVTVTLEWQDGGQTYRRERKLKKDRIVAIVEGGKFRVANVTKPELGLVK